MYSKLIPSGIIIDTDLRTYALSRGYRLLRSPVDAAELYVNPAMLPASAPLAPPPA